MNFTGLRSLSTSDFLALSNDEVHVWCASLDRSPESIENLALLLSVEERTRAARFYFERDRKHFIMGRGLLRMILSSYLGMKPAQVRFHYGPNGKPALKAGAHGKTVQFNLSHSQDVALYAICCNRQVGVDVEYIQTVPEADRIAEDFFSPHESAMIHACSEEHKMDLFFHMWTYKEAYLKASGEGLTRPLTEIKTLPVYGEPAHLFSTVGDRREAFQWRMQSFRPQPGYLAAVVAEGNDWHAKFGELGAGNINEFL